MGTQRYSILIILNQYHRNNGRQDHASADQFSDADIRFLNDVKYSFNSYTMDRTAIAAGVAAVEDKAYFDETCNKIIETREWTKKELKALGFSFQDSMSNFIFATHKTCPAKELFEALRGQHIYVRYFQKDRIDNFLRITVGTKEEMQKFIDFLKDYLK